MRSRSKGSSPRNMAAISVSISALVTSPPRVSPRPSSPSSVCIWMTSRVQSALAPPDQRIGATKGTLTTLTSIFEIFMPPPSSSPGRPARDDKILAGDPQRLLPAEEDGERGDLARFDQPLLGIALGDQAEVLLDIAALPALLDAKARADAGEAGGDGARADGVAGDA